MLHPIVLLTDFGLGDPYVGQMKGAMLRLAPTATIVDLTHDVLPHNVTQAAFLLRASRPHFPANSIFVAVVDPGVGTERALVLAQSSGHIFLAPDNGLLGFLPDNATLWRRIPQPAQASPTFHGRDILAPLAARLATGLAPESVGAELDPATVIRLPRPDLYLEHAPLRCQVVHVDRFGNCLLDLPASAATGRVWRLGLHLVREVQTYADLAPEEIGMLAGSQTVMELAMNQQSCAKALGLGPGSTVQLTAEIRP